jgi:mycothiol synthase
VQGNVGEDSWSKVWMQHAGQRRVKVYQPPTGFTVCPLAGKQEVEAYTELHRAVFESKSMTADWRGRTLLHPD